MSGSFQNWLEQAMPTRDGMRKNKYLKPIAHRIFGNELWRFTRRSVPRGVALGMLAAFLVPLGQIFVAAFLALPVRANVPVAAVTTFITNPLTYPFWVVIANRLGTFLLQIDAMTYGAPLNEQVRSGFGEWVSWFLEVAGVTAFGFIVLAVVSASLGYVVSSVGWRMWIVHKRRQRKLKASVIPLD